MDIKGLTRPSRNVQKRGRWTDTQNRMVQRLENLEESGLASLSMDMSARVAEEIARKEAGERLGVRFSPGPALIDSRRVGPGPQMPLLFRSEMLREDAGVPQRRLTREEANRILLERSAVGRRR